MDPTSIISGSDNLWKYLFTLGTFMFVLAILYPLQKGQELELEINHYNQEIATLNVQIDNLKDRVKSFSYLANRSVQQIDSLQQLSKKTKVPGEIKAINSSIVAIRKNFNDWDQSLKKEREEIGIKDVVYTYNKCRIELLQNHLSDFKDYTKWLLIMGIGLAAIGLIFWTRNTIKKDFPKGTGHAQPSQ